MSSSCFLEENDINTFRSSPRLDFVPRKGCSVKFCKRHRKTTIPEYFLRKLQSPGCRPTTLVKRVPGKGVSCEFFEIFQNKFSIKHQDNLREILPVCYYHATYAFQSESTLYNCLEIKTLLARNRRDYLVRKRTPNHLVKLTTDWAVLWVLVCTVHLTVCYYCGFESCCCHLNFRYQACFEQGFPWHSGKYSV